MVDCLSIKQIAVSSFIGTFNDFEIHAKIVICIKLICT